MANRYLVAAGGWMDYQSWSATSGGAPGASSPTSADDVFFDSNSPGGTLSVESFSYAKSINATGLNNNLSITGNTINVSGNITLSSRINASSTLRVSNGATSNFTRNGAVVGSLTGAGNSTINLQDDFVGTTLQIGIVSADTNASLNTNSHNITVGTFTIYSPLSIDFGYSTLECSQINTYSLGANKIVDSEWTLVYNLNGNKTFNTANWKFNDAVFNMGAGTSSGVTLTIQGSPTFRFLTIQSKNSSTHTVNFDNYAQIGVQKFIAIGSSSANRLILNSPSAGGDAAAAINASDSVYGQNVSLQYIDSDNVSTTPWYLGTNSVSEGGNWSPPYTGHWSHSTNLYLQDPPKIDTLIEPFTTAAASNSNWGVTGSVTTLTGGASGGGYRFPDNARMVSTGVFDPIDSTMIFEFLNLPTNQEEEFTVGIGYPVDGFFGYESDIVGGPIVGFTLFYGDISTWNMDYSGSSDPRPAGSKLYVRITFTTTGYSYHTRTTGAWSSLGGYSYPAGFDINKLRSSRIYIGNQSYSGDSIDVGAINILPNEAPTIAPNTPDLKVFSTPAPTLEFTGTDTEGNPITYQIQVHTNDTFGESPGGGPPPVAR